MPTTRHFLVLTALLLAACEQGEVQSALGMDRNAPDEFVVYSRPPLSVPPEFDLKPPRPGEESPNIVTTEDQARELLLGTKRSPATLDEAAAKVNTKVETAVEPVLSTEAATGAKASFLAKAGVDEADPEIRDRLVKDTKVENKQKKKAQSLYERVVGDEADEPVVDAKGESERIRKNRDEGKAITEGKTPDKDQKPKSVIDKIF